MNNVEKRTEERAVSLRRLDYRIRATKAALSPDHVYWRSMGNPAKSFTTYDEFGLSASKMPIMGRYFWLLAKLGVLYGIKLYRRLNSPAERNS